MRKNRRDPDSPIHDAIHTTPAVYTRESRRAAGHRGGVHVASMRSFYADNTVLPRAVRRLMRDTLKAEQRVRRGRAKVNRLLVRYGKAI